MARTLNCLHPRLTPTGRKSREMRPCLSAVPESLTDTPTRQYLSMLRRQCLSYFAGSILAYAVRNVPELPEEYGEVISKFNAM
jgi:hypothetical protein